MPMNTERLTALAISCLARTDITDLIVEFDDNDALALHLIDDLELTELERQELLVILADLLDEGENAND